MRKMKKVLALALCLAFAALALAGCGGGEADAPAAESDVIKIAYIGPLTGDNTLYGTTQKNAITLAVDQVNAEGGIGGKQVVVEWNDDKSDPNETVSLASKVADDDSITAIFGPFSTTSAMACAQTLIDAKIPVCSGSVSHPDWSGMGEGRFFRGDSTQVQMMTAYADFLVNKMGVTKVAMYYVQSDWGVAVYDSFIEEFGKLGGKVVYSDMFPLGTKDFTPSLSKFKEHDSEYEVFFLAGHITEASLIVNQMRKLGIDKPLITNNSLQMQEYLDIVGENAEGQILLGYFAETGNTDRFEEFRKNFEERFGTKVDTHAFNTTDLILVMFEALRNSGADREKFVEEMHKIKDFQGLQTKITMLENGDMDKPFTPVVVKDGKFVVWTKE